MYVIWASVAVKLDVQTEFASRGYFYPANQEPITHAPLQDWLDERYDINSCDNNRTPKITANVFFVDDFVVLDGTNTERGLPAGDSTARARKNRVMTVPQLL